MKTAITHHQTPNKKEPPTTNNQQQPTTNNQQQTNDTNPIGIFPIFLLLMHLGKFVSFQLTLESAFGRL